MASNSESDETGWGLQCIEDVESSVEDDGAVIRSENELSWDESSDTDVKAQRFEDLKVSKIDECRKFEKSDRIYNLSGIRKIKEDTEIFEPNNSVDFEKSDGIYGSTNINKVREDTVIFETNNAVISETPEHPCESLTPPEIHGTRSKENAPFFDILDSQSKVDESNCKTSVNKPKSVYPSESIESDFINSSTYRDAEFEVPDSSPPGQSELHPHSGPQTLKSVFEKVLRSQSTHLESGATSSLRPITPELRTLKYLRTAESDIERRHSYDSGSPGTGDNNGTTTPHHKNFIAEYSKINVCSEYDNQKRSNISHSEVKTNDSADIVFEKSLEEDLDYSSEDSTQRHCEDPIDPHTESQDIIFGGSESSGEPELSGGLEIQDVHSFPPGESKLRGIISREFQDKHPSPPGDTPSYPPVACESKDIDSNLPVLLRQPIDRRPSLTLLQDERTREFSMKDERTCGPSIKDEITHHPSINDERVRESVIKDEKTVTPLKSIIKDTTNVRLLIDSQTTPTPSKNEEAENVHVGISKENLKSDSIVDLQPSSPTLHPEYDHVDIKLPFTDFRSTKDQEMRTEESKTYDGKLELESDSSEEQQFVLTSISDSESIENSEQREVETPCPPGKKGVYNHLICSEPSDVLETDMDAPLHPKAASLSQLSSKALSKNNCKEASSSLYHSKDISITQDPMTLRQEPVTPCSDHRLKGVSSSLDPIKDISIAQDPLSDQYIPFEDNCDDLPSSPSPIKDVSIAQDPLSDQYVSFEAEYDQNLCDKTIFHPHTDDLYLDETASSSVLPDFDSKTFNVNSDDNTLNSSDTDQSTHNSNLTYDDCVVTDNESVLRPNLFIKESDCVIEEDSVKERQRVLNCFDENELTKSDMNSEKRHSSEFVSDRNDEKRGGSGFVSDMNNDKRDASEFVWPNESEAADHYNHPEGSFDFNSEGLCSVETTISGEVVKKEPFLPFNYSECSFPSNPNNEGVCSVETPISGEVVKKETFLPFNHSECLFSLNLDNESYDLVENPKLRNTADDGPRTTECLQFLDVPSQSPVLIQPAIENEETPGRFISIEDDQLNSDFFFSGDSHIKGLSVNLEPLISNGDTLDLNTDLPLDLYAKNESDTEFGISKELVLQHTQQSDCRHTQNGEERAGGISSTDQETDRLYKNNSESHMCYFEPIETEHHTITCSIEPCDTNYLNTTSKSSIGPIETEHHTMKCPIKPCDTNFQHKTSKNPIELFGTNYQQTLPECLSMPQTDQSVCNTLVSAFPHLTKKTCFPNAQQERETVSKNTYGYVNKRSLIPQTSKTPSFVSEPAHSPSKVVRSLTEHGTGFVPENSRNPSDLHSLKTQNESIHSPNDLGLKESWHQGSYYSISAQNTDIRPLNGLDLKEFSHPGDLHSFRSQNERILPPNRIPSKESAKTVLIETEISQKILPSSQRSFIPPRKKVKNFVILTNSILECSNLFQLNQNRAFLFHKFKHPICVYDKLHTSKKSCVNVSQLVGQFNLPEPLKITHPSDFNNMDRFRSQDNVFLSKRDILGVFIEDPVKALHEALNHGFYDLVFLLQQSPIFEDEPKGSREGVYGDILSIKRQNTPSDIPLDTYIPDDRSISKGKYIPGDGYKAQTSSFDTILGCSGYMNPSNHPLDGYGLEKCHERAFRRLNDTSEGNNYSPDIPIAPKNNLQNQDSKPWSLQRMRHQKSLLIANYLKTIIGSESIPVVLLNLGYYTESLLYIENIQQSYIQYFNYLSNNFKFIIPTFIAVLSKQSLERAAECFLISLERNLPLDYDLIQYSINQAYGRMIVKKLWERKREKTATKICESILRRFEVISQSKSEEVFQSLRGYMTSEVRCLYTKRFMRDRKWIKGLKSAVHMGISKMMGFDCVESVNDQKMDKTGDDSTNYEAFSQNLNNDYSISNKESQNDTLESVSGSETSTAAQDFHICIKESQNDMLESVYISETATANNDYSISNKESQNDTSEAVSGSETSTAAQDFHICVKEGTLEFNNGQSAVSSCYQTVSRGSPIPGSSRIPETQQSVADSAEYDQCHSKEISAASNISEIFSNENEDFDLEDLPTTDTEKKVDSQADSGEITASNSMYNYRNIFSDNSERRFNNSDASDDDLDGNIQRIMNRSDNLGSNGQIRNDQSKFKANELLLMKQKQSNTSLNLIDSSEDEESDENDIDDAVSHKKVRLEGQNGVLLDNNAQKSFNSLFIERTPFQNSDGNSQSEKNVQVSSQGSAENSQSYACIPKYARNSAQSWIGLCGHTEIVPINKQSDVLLNVTDQLTPVSAHHPTSQEFVGEKLSGTNLTARKHDQPVSPKNLPFNYPPEHSKVTYNSLKVGSENESAHHSTYEDTINSFEQIYSNQQHSKGHADLSDSTNKVARGNDAPSAYSNQQHSKSYAGFSDSTNKVASENDATSLYSNQQHAKSFAELFDPSNSNLNAGVEENVAPSLYSNSQYSQSLADLQDSTENYPSGNDAPSIYSNPQYSQSFADFFESSNAGAEENTAHSFLKTLDDGKDDIVPRKDQSKNDEDPEKSSSLFSIFKIFTKKKKYKVNIESDASFVYDKETKKWINKSQKEKPHIFTQQKQKETVLPSIGPKNMSCINLSVQNKNNDSLSSRYAGIKKTTTSGVDFSVKPTKNKD